MFILAENSVKELPDYIVRRLTPTECERLQAYPDDWCDIPPFEYTDKRGKKKLKKITDSDKYKALGNSIATCAWTDILQRISRHCKEKTLGSLFDGIGGFPLIWVRDCEGRAVWASEIEPYCIAVTEHRFPEGAEPKICSQNRNVERERITASPDESGTIVRDLYKMVGNTQDSATVAIIPNETKVYDHHPNDSRVTELDDTANSVCSRYGTGGATCR